MPGRSLARYLAPLSLVVFSVALLLIVTSGGESARDTGATPASEEQTSGGREGRSQQDEPRRRTGRRTYRVRPGDTPSTIAEKTGIPLEQIQELNPELDPQQLSPGQRLRLRP